MSATHGAAQPSLAARLTAQLGDADLTFPTGAGPIGLRAAIVDRLAAPGGSRLLPVFLRFDELAEAYSRETQTPRCVAVMARPIRDADRRGLAGVLAGGGS